MIGEIYNEDEEQKYDKNKKEKKEQENIVKKPKKLKTKVCSNCKELKIKIQELEQLNTKLMQANKNLKQTNKDMIEKLNDALKQNENLTQENERLQKLLQEMEQENGANNNINKKMPLKKFSSKEESSENEEEKENDEDKDNEEEKEKEEEKEENEIERVIERDGEEESQSEENENLKKIKNKNKIKPKLINKNLLTNEVISDILERVSELEKFRIFMEASSQATDSKITYLESKVLNMSRKSSDDLGVPTTINSKENKLIPPLISKSLHGYNEYNKNQIDEALLSKSAINNYNYVNNSKKIKNNKNSFNKKILSENYIKSQNPKTKLNSYKFNSKILNDTEDLDLIALGLVLGDLEKLKNLKVGYKLIYRASTNGDSVKNFHKKCDNINGTLTVIKTKDGLVFGGYCSVCWESGDELIKEDLNSFVFSINLSKIYFVSKNNEASILCDKNKGPSFIGMFTINDNMLSMRSDINPWGTQRYSGESSLYEINGGEPSFIIEEIEVFQVLFR